MKIKFRFHGSKADYHKNHEGGNWIIKGNLFESKLEGMIANLNKLDIPTFYGHSFPTLNLQIWFIAPKDTCVADKEVTS